MITRADAEAAVSDLRLPSCRANSIIMDSEALRVVLGIAHQVIALGASELTVISIYVSGTVLGYQLAVAEQRRLVGATIYPTSSVPPGLPEPQAESPAAGESAG